jgi:CMP-N,N'-diacetyllegionaminic acid synthase
MGVVRVLGLVPARGGSRGIPRKNARMLGGKPLLAYTIEAALAARRINRVVVSTDDDEVAEIGRRCGAEVPFRRPDDLARDETPMLGVVQHALRTLQQEGDRFDAVCLLQPTSPFRERDEIDGCIDQLERSAADAVVTVRAVPQEYNPHWVYFADDAGVLTLSTDERVPITRRQDLPSAFHRDGSVYVTRTAVVLEENSLYGSRLVGYEIHGERRVNLDSPEDWSHAERLLVAMAH